MNNLDETIKKAKDLDSYFITLTTKDESREENNLKHYVFRQKFGQDDIVPSLDSCVRSMGIKAEKPVDIIKPPKIIGKKEPLKIVIVSHFNSMPQSYSPARAVRNQIKILLKYGHDVTVFLQENSKLTKEDLGCNVERVIPKFKREKMVVNKEVKRKLINLFREELTGNYDIAITHDFFLQDTVTFSEAIRECGVDIPWLNFARSGVGHNMDFSMPNARFVYLNYTDAGKFGKAIKVEPDQIRTVQNEKDPAFMFDWHPVTKMIVNKFHLWDRDIIQTYPICSTRFDAKGIDSVIKIFVELKRLGNKVALIIANANGRKRVDDLKRKQEMAEKMGLNNNEFIITSLLADEEYHIESEVPNQVCAELMQISNLMILATVAEVSSNILLEASITKQLLVLNSDLPCLYDAVNEDAILSYPFTSSRSLHYSGRDNEELNRLAKKIVGELKSNKSDLQFRHVWKKYNSYSIYYNFLEPILYENLQHKCKNETRELGKVCETPREPIQSRRSEISFKESRG